MISARKVLELLPPYQGTEVMIEPDQDVSDIEDEIIAQHKYYAADYDEIAECFWTGNIYNTCERLWDFCKKNIRYEAESVEDQTTKSPAAILTDKLGDCKHYSSFIGGILSAINRVYGAGIKWNYEFASYKFGVNTPQHVFVIAYDDEGDIWVDPVLSRFNERLTPYAAKPKKVNDMSLRRISGINDDLFGYEYDSFEPAAIGWTWQTSAGWSNSSTPIVPRVGDPFYGSDWLGLSRYGNMGSTNLTTLTQQLQTLINSGPRPYQLGSDRVAKIINENVQYWNFFYDNGTSDVPRDWKSRPEYTSYLALTITPDGRLTFDRDEEPPHDLPYIHILSDEANFLIQHYSDAPWIPTLEHMKRLGKGWNTPGGGSLWHVIHQGDVNAAKISQMIAKIPLISQALNYFGVDMADIEKLVNFVGTNPGAVTITSNGGDSSTGLPTIPTPGTTNAGLSALPLILLGGGLLMMSGKKNRKKRVSGIQKDDTPWLLLGAGALALFLFNKKKAPTPQIEEPAPQDQLPLSTATPPYVDAKQVDPMQATPIEISEDVVLRQPKTLPDKDSIIFLNENYEYEFRS